MWTECLALYPVPRFSRKSIHHLWSQINHKLWTRDEDQLKSAKILLQEGSTKGQLGRYALKSIVLPSEDGFTAIGWSLPDVMQQWGGRIREVAMDSTCMFDLLV